MPKFNTGNPVGSSDPRDLFDNSVVIDNLVTGAGAAYNDRLGKSRKSWQGMEEEFAAFIAASGYEFVGDYAAGIEITGYNQVVRDSGGEFWRVSGSTTLPYTTTGAGLSEGGAFLAVGDAALRQELNGPLSSGQGAALVKGATIYVGGVAELERLSLDAGVNVYLTEDGRAGEFVVRSGTPPSDPQKGIYIVLDNGNYAERIRGNELRSSWFGVVGDYDEATKTGTDDTVAAQAWFDQISDGDHVIADRYPYVNINSAAVKTVQGVSSYILVCSGKKDVRFTGKVWQKHDSATDSVGVCFYQCEDLHLDHPVYDGDFRYDTADPINFKQQLLHLIDNKRMTGSFTVRRSSNVGFLISNQHGDEGSGFININETESSFDTIISDNCLQNTTFGTGVKGLNINSLMILNPVASGLKISSRVSATAQANAFERLQIGMMSLSFDSTWKLPNKEDNSGPHDAIAGLDFVSCAQDVHIGALIEDWENCLIASLGAKQVPQTVNDSSRPAGPLRIGFLSVKNQNFANSVCFEKDVEATGTTIDVMECYSVSKLIQISDIASATAQPKKDKFLYVGRLYARDHDRVAVNVLNLNADYVLIKDFDVEAESGFTQQSVRFDATCDLNSIEITGISCNSVVTILGTVNDKITLVGDIDSSAQAADPLTINLSSGAPVTSLDLSISGDSGSFRKCLIGNAGDVKIYGFNLAGCPQGASVVSPDSFRIADMNQTYSDLSVTQPWQLSGTLGPIQGCFSYAGSPNSTQVGDIGCSYRRRDTGQLYMKTGDSGLNTGWSPLT